MLSPVLQKLKITLPSGLTGTVTTKREATLDATNDLSKPASLTTTTTVNGKSSKSVYTATEKKVVTTSAVGRVTAKLLDEKGRVSQTSIPSLEPVHYTDDARGRLTQVTQGQGEDLRTVTLSYDNSGEVSSRRLDFASRSPTPNGIKIMGLSRSSVRPTYSRSSQPTRANLSTPETKFLRAAQS
jgi:YD repeat-containing protein